MPWVYLSRIWLLDQSWLPDSSPDLCQWNDQRWVFQTQRENSRMLIFKKVLSWKRKTKEKFNLGTNHHPVGFWSKGTSLCLMSEEAVSPLHNKQDWCDRAYRKNSLYLLNRSVLGKQLILHVKKAGKTFNWGRFIKSSVVFVTAQFHIFREINLAFTWTL